MCNGPALAHWQAECIRHLLEWGRAQLEIVIMAEKTETEVNLGFWHRLRRKISTNLFFRFWYRFFVKLSGTRNVPLTQVACDVPIRKVRIVKKGRFSEYFSQEDTTAVRRFDLDFVLRFGFGIIRGEILRTPRYGVWSFHHGDERKFRGRPSAFWEMYYGSTTIGGILQQLTDRLDGGVILKRWAIRNNKVCWARNIDALRYAGTELPKQVCIDIVNGAADYLEAEESTTSAPIRYFPTNVEMCVFLARVWWNKVSQVFSALFLSEDWNIGIADAAIADFLETKDSPSIKWLPERPKGNFSADPFGFFLDGQLEIYFEEFEYSQDKGHIQRMTVDSNHQVINGNTVLSSNIHLSYPFLLARDGEVFAIPETSRAGKVTLYWVDRKTNKLQEVATMLENVRLSEPTVFRYEGRWWLFGTIDALRLCAWYADSLMGPWQVHANNPVKIDIGAARPAGTPFIVDGILYRPAQDCAETYGGRIVLNRVTTLTPTKFQEERVRVIEPDRKGLYPAGLHTLAAAGPVTLLDGKRWVFRPKVTTRKITRKLLHWSASQT